MLEVKNRFETKIYHAGLGFWVEITLDREARFGALYECYLWHEGYGVKDEMFGLPEYQKCNDKHYSWADIEEIVEGNLPQYMAFYEEDYMDGCDDCDDCEE